MGINFLRKMRKCWWTFHIFFLLESSRARGYISRLVTFYRAHLNMLQCWRSFYSDYSSFYKDAVFTFHVASSLSRFHVIRVRFSADGVAASQRLLVYDDLRLKIDHFTVAFVHILKEEKSSQFHCPSFLLTSWKLSLSSLHLVAIINPFLSSLRFGKDFLFFFLRIFRYVLRPLTWEIELKRTENFVVIFSAPQDI